jgi:hypothetical protein
MLKILGLIPSTTKEKKKNSCLFSSHYFSPTSVLGPLSPPVDRPQSFPNFITGIDLNFRAIWDSQVLSEPLPRLLDSWKAPDQTMRS